MKRKLKLAGIIVSAIGFAILVSMAIVGIITPNYNYYNYNGFRAPDWLGVVASLITFAYLLLILKGNIQKSIVRVYGMLTLTGNTPTCHLKMEHN
jgi:hypothetical protein